jgi:hypothetical protein
MARPTPASEEERVVSDELRQDALRRASIWRPPGVRIDQARIGPERNLDALSCWFLVTSLGGTTPKFDCRLETGERIRVKYGMGSEIPAEAAASRLLGALGFAVDDVALVRTLRCYGCPLEPFVTLKAVETARIGALYAPGIDYSIVREFPWVAVERKYDAWPVETRTREGWPFYELDVIDAARGGAPRAHVDALRLLAAFLAHWDNKAENQRLVCASRNWPANVRCPEPLVLLQDLGATFGPRKVDLDGWSVSSVWADRAPCRVTMQHLPYRGATFNDVHVGEEGRRFLLDLLGQLSDAQVESLFAGARFDRPRRIVRDARPVADWARAFKARVRMISDGPPCPPVSPDAAASTSPARG